MSKSQFDKLKIHLWVAGTTDPEGNGGWCSHLHSIVENHDYTKTIGGYGKDTTITRMTLLAVLAGLKQLKENKAVFVEIYTSVVQVSSGLNRNMYKWAKNGWLTTKGTYPMHMDLWKEIHEILTDTNRVLAYRVHLQSQANNHQPQRLYAIHNSAKYLQEGKRDLYEVYVS